MLGQEFEKTKGLFVMTHICRSMVDELRGWTRFAKERGTDVAVIFHPEREQLIAEVHDESLAGLGLRLHDVEGFEVGQEVEILYSNDFFRARVRHIEPQDDDGFLVGFACERTESSAV